MNNNNNNKGAGGRQLHFVPTALHLSLPRVRPPSPPPQLQAKSIARGVRNGIFLSSNWEMCFDKARGAGRGPADTVPRAGEGGRARPRQGHWGFAAAAGGSWEEVVAVGTSFGSRHSSRGLGQLWVGGRATVDDCARTKKGQKSPFFPQVVLCCRVCSSLLGSKGRPRKPAPGRSEVPWDTVMVQTPPGDTAALPPHNMMSHTSLPKPAVLTKVRQLGMRHHSEREEATSPPGLSLSCNVHAWMSLWRRPREQWTLVLQVSLSVVDISPHLQPCRPDLLHCLEISLSSGKPATVVPRHDQVFRRHQPHPAPGHWGAANLRSAQKMLGMGSAPYRGGKTGLIPMAERWGGGWKPWEG